jgi:hypothetical protein
MTMTQCKIGLVLVVAGLLMAAQTARAQNDAYAHFQYGGASCGEFIKGEMEYEKHGMK